MDAVIPSEARNLVPHQSNLRDSSSLSVPWNGSM